MASQKILPRSFYSRNTHDVARDLLGKVIVRNVRNATIQGRITEVESYVGKNDKACHASRGRTKRTEAMFGEAGHAYIYLVYGMYYCFNIVTDKKDFPAAVLIRSVEPVAGIEYMQRLRHSKHINNLTTGPGKLAQAMAITSSLYACDVTKPQSLYVIDDGFSVGHNDIATTPRIGVGYAGNDALLLWRYVLATSPFISRPL